MTPEEDRPLTEEEFFAAMRKAWSAPSWRYPNPSEEASLESDHLFRWLELIHKALGHIVALLMLATLLLSFVVFMLGWKL